MESQEVMTSISMDTNTFGITVTGITIYYCTKENGLKMLNLDDKSQSHIIRSGISSVYYVDTSEDKLFYTDCIAHTVTCCDSHGTTQWVFRDKHILQGPRGISVYENVYVVGQGSNNVVVFSPDGERHRQLLSSKDGLVNPFVLDYDKSTNRLLVVNEKRAAFLFDVTKGE